MPTWSRMHTLDGAGTDAATGAIDTLGSDTFTLMINVPASWDRAATVTVDVSDDGVKWSPGAVGGTASPISQTVVATDDGKLFFVNVTGKVFRYLRVTYDNTTAGTVGTLKMTLLIGQPNDSGWISTSG